MLDEYKETQAVAYKIFMNEINNKKYSHAYILETNGFHNPMSFAIKMAKALFCIDTKNTDKILELIDTNNFPELKIIDPEGLTIKKEDIEDLQYEFAKKPVYSDKKIYIINNANRLNGSSANALLKFLEEPNQDIVAILVVNNMYEMMETILSRCQIISLIPEKTNLKELEIKDRILYMLNKTEEELKIIFETENIEELLFKSIDFIKYYESHKSDSFIYINKIWFDYYKTKESFDVAYQIMVLYYTDILRISCGAFPNIFFEQYEEMQKIGNELSLNNISGKIKIITNIDKRVKQNNNLNLLMDKLLIEFRRCDINE